MGRPACSSCCKVVPVIPPAYGTGCVDGADLNSSFYGRDPNPLFDHGHDIYYKIGGGGWKTQNQYDAYREENWDGVFKVGQKVLYSPPLGVYGRGRAMGEFPYIITDIEQSNIAPYGTNLQLTISTADGVPPFWVDSLDVKLDVDRGGGMFGFRGLEAIKYTKSKADYGEYMSTLNCWNFPMFFYDRSMFESSQYGPVQKSVISKLPDSRWWNNPNNLQLGDPCPYGLVGLGGQCIGAVDYEFQSGGGYGMGNPDVGFHLPSRWTITIGSSKGKQIKVVKQLVGRKTLSDWATISIWNETPVLSEDGWPTGTSTWKLNSSLSENKTLAVEWTTDITYGDKLIFSGSECIPYEGPLRVDRNKYATGLRDTEKILKFDPYLRCYTVMSYSQASGGVYIIGNKAPVETCFTSGYATAVPSISCSRFSENYPTALDQYMLFSYCLTYPFFVFDNAGKFHREGGFTHYFYNNEQCNTAPLPASVITDFNSGDLVKVKFSAVRLGPAENDIELVFSSDDFGDVEPPRINVVGKQINIILNTNRDNESTAADLVTALNQDFNAPGLIFTEVIAGNENMEIALRPNSYSPLFTAGASDGAIEDSELEFYHANKELFNEIAVESSDFIIFNPYSGVGPQGLGRKVTDNDLARYEIDAEGRKDGLTPKSPRPCDKGGMHTVGTPFFQYSDNKIRMEKDLPQNIIAEEGSLNGIVEFPQGWTIPDRDTVGITSPLVTQGQAVELFKEHMEYQKFDTYKANPGGKTGDPVEGGTNIIIVEFRTKRGADKSWVNIVDEWTDQLKDGMEVYHPIGSDDPNDQYTIEKILTHGPDLKPLEIRLSGGKVVNLSEVELAIDVFRYGMNDRTYALQLTYLKALSAKEGKDYYNPLKYRVTRIDLVNPDIDIDCTGDEIAGHPEMVDIEVGGKVYYPIGLDVNGDPAVSHKYTIAAIVGKGPDGKPTSVELSNGDVVDVSDIELINEDENPTYITLTEIAPDSGPVTGWRQMPRRPDGSLDERYRRSWKWEWPWRYQWYQWRRLHGANQRSRDSGKQAIDAIEKSKYWRLSEGNPATLELAPMRNKFGSPVSTGAAGTEGLISDKMGQGLEPLTVTGPMFFQELETSDDKKFEKADVFASYPMLHPTEDGFWDITFGNVEVPQGEASRCLIDYTTVSSSGKEYDNGMCNSQKRMAFITRQLPENGYLFGGDLKLKFYLEEIEGWKNKQI